MNTFDPSTLPDPGSAPKASAEDRQRAAEMIGQVPNYFDLAPGDRLEAQQRIAEALRLDPHNPHGWFNLGIHLKWTRQWAACALCNQRAIQLEDLPEESPEFWNLGIASTALRDWPTAREAWTNYGLTLSPGAEVVEDYGMCPVRIFNGERYAEVIWGARIGPARIQLQNVPLPQSGHRWNDIVLHDGSPNGSRTWHGHEYPVFEELERWQASDVVTLECLVQGEDADIKELLGMFPSGECGAEDWTASVRMLCQECSEGNPSEDHRHGNFLASEDGRTIGIAADVAQAEQILDEWVALSPARTRSDVFNAETTTF